MRIIQVLLWMTLCLPVFSHAEAKLEKVSVCLPRFRHEFLSLLTLEGIDQSFFKKRGLDVTVLYSGERGNGNGGVWRNVGRGPITRPANLDRQVASQVGEHPEICAFGSSNVDRFIMDPAQQEWTTPLLVSAYGNQYDTHIMVAKNSNIKSPKDLKGKSIRVGQLPTYFATLQVLRNSGLGAKDVRFEGDHDSIEKVEALKAGRIAGLVTYMPLTAYMLASGDFRSIAANIVKENIQNSIPHSLLIVNKAYAAKSPAVVTAFREAMMDAYQYLMRNPSEVVRIVERHSMQLNGVPWKVSDVVAERSGTFVGKVLMVDLTAAGEIEQKKKILCDIGQYNKKMKEQTFFTSETDFSRWFGVESKDLNCAKGV